MSQERTDGEISAKEMMDMVTFSGSAKEIHQIAESISYCGLICNLCHLADQCDGCHSQNNCCGCKTSPVGCYQYNCCKEKEIEGCWQCEEALCDKGMFGAGHDLRLRVFIEYIREHGKEMLAEKIYFNMQKGIFYGHGKDYDNLSDEQAVIAKLEGSWSSP